MSKETLTRSGNALAWVLVAFAIPACSRGGGQGEGTTLHATNLPPSVTLLKPSSGATFPPSTDITLEAEASDPDGTILRVDFFDGPAWLGSATVEPYTFVWSGASIGAHCLVAVATDQGGMQGRSLPVSICVATPPPGWVSIGPVNPPLDFRAVFFTDSLHGWALSNNGVIVSTIDGGQNWVLQTSNTAAALQKLQFVDSSTGWIVGGSGTILKTTDCGQTWTLQSSGTDVFLTGLSFVSPTEGWVCGQDGTILKTSDGGATWTPQDSAFNLGLEAIFFMNPLRGWAVGAFGTILSTTDGGATWSSQHFERTNGGMPEVPGFTDVRFVSSLRGLVVGIERDGGIILSTEDGGATWIPHAPLQTTQAAGTLTGLTAVAFGDALHAWAVGVSGTIWATTDGGATWTLQPIGSLELLSGVSFIDGNVGWVIGSHGTLLKTTTGGR